MTAKLRIGQAVVKAEIGKEPIPREGYDQAHLEYRMGDVFERFGKTMETEELVYYELLLNGGECEICGRGWVPTHVLHQVEVDGKVVRTFADFTVYQPVCGCYKQCETAGVTVEIYSKKGKREVVRRRPGCGELLVVERLMTLHGKDQRTCRNCGGIIL